MKLFVQLILFFFIASAQAQEFKPFKVKSGKIIYEKWNYSTVAGFSSINGVESSYSKQVSYTAEEVIYYWDEFGDIAFEEVFQVSELGGKPLPEKVKIAERLWIGDHQYYFDAKKNQVIDHFYDLRIICRENFQYYQIKKSWIETLYMGAEKSGTKEILGEVADYYKIDEDQDICAWKGLVLKNEDFATTRKGERLYPHRTKIAIKIDTLLKIDKNKFDPIWLKREQLYQSFDRNKMDELLDTRPDLLLQADNVEGIEIEKNDILFFVSTEYHLGKMQVLAISKDVIIVKFEWYYNDNALGNYRELFDVEKNTLIDIDEVISKEEKTKEVDFKWDNVEKSILFPQNNIGIYLLKSSRNNNF